MGIDEIFAEERRRADEQRALSRKNLPILAERLQWPDGALEACVRLEDDNPGWSVSWMRESPISNRTDAGYCATRERPSTKLFHPDPDRLQELMHQSPGDPWRT